MMRQLTDTALASILPLALLSLWEIGCRSGFLPASLVAPPSEIVRQFGIMVADGVLLGHAARSLERLAVGVTLGAGLGLALGVCVGASTRAERVLAPTVAFLAPVPVTAWIPLVIILIGVEEPSKHAILAIGAFFPVFFGTLQGMKSASLDLFEVCQLHRKSTLTRIRVLLLPSAAPFIFQSLKAAISLSWILLVVAEVIASDNGLGWLLWDARTFGRPADMIVAMITTGLLGALSVALVGAVEQRVIFWDRPRLSYAGTRADGK